MGVLTDKVAFITGAASGIGRATAKRLAADGAKVFSLGLDGAALASLQGELGADRFAFLEGSVADEGQIDAAFAACDAAFGPVDILVNNAGLGIPTPDLATADLSVFRTQFDVNVQGVFLASRAALRRMKPRGSGHIITLISMAGQRTNPGAPLYCASKFGARGLSGGLADQALKYGVKVSDINPGPVDSAYWGDRKVAREKFLKVEEVADVIAFVAGTPAHLVIREINFDNMKWLAQ